MLKVARLQSEVGTKFVFELRISFRTMLRNFEIYFVGPKNPENSRQKSHNFLANISPTSFCRSAGRAITSRNSKRNSFCQNYTYNDTCVEIPATWHRTKMGIPEKCWRGCRHTCWQKWGCWPECWHRRWQVGPFGKTETKQRASICASIPASAPIFASTCASTPASTSLEFPFRGPVPVRRDLNTCERALLEGPESPRLKCHFRSGSRKGS